MDKIKVGAVIYAPKVTVIWEIIAKFFEDEHCPIEPIGWTLFLELKENV